jgi:hypothetical protein
VTVHQIVPSPETLLALEPEELAGVLLEYLNSWDLSKRGQGLHRSHLDGPDVVTTYPPQFHDRIRAALSEGWAWLQREGCWCQSLVTTTVDDS